LEFVEICVILLILASWIYWIVALRSFDEFVTERKKEAQEDFTPPVSILKPVKGLDPYAYENFASFCTQDYPEYEVIFGVIGHEDPALPVIGKIMRDFPDRKVKAVVAKPIGSNNKASILFHLSKEAEYDIFVINDSDMRVDPSYLRRVIAPLRDPDIGMVTCFYKNGMVENLVAKVEALMINLIYFPSALIGLFKLGMPYAFGATMAVRRNDLERIGGFEPILSHIVDDYILGFKIGKELKKKIYLSDYMPTNVMGEVKWGDFWNRQVRWMKGAWIGRRRQYPGMLLLFAIPISFIYWILSGFSPISTWFLGTSIIIRTAISWTIAGYIGREEMRRWLWLLPVSDLLYAVLWAYAMVGNKIDWRGEKYRIGEGGLLIPLDQDRYGFFGEILRYMKLRK
jgi:ceramide glucosyltransferase